jgi:SAM-dependent methyltransferase
MDDSLNSTVKDFSKSLGSRFPMFSDSVDRAYRRHGETWLQGFSHDLEAIFEEAGNDNWSGPVEGYARFTFDAARSQRVFEITGHYTGVSNDALQDRYYSDPDFMFRNYLPGLFVSFYLWPHHYRLIEYYRLVIQPKLVELQPETFCEVGVGTGIYSRETLRALPGVRGVGYDLSDHSLAFSQRVMDRSGLGDRYRAERRNILTSTPEPVDYLICQEVLEHLDDPAEFSRALFAMVKPGGHAYITAAITAGHADHVYVYQEPADARAHVEAAGFEVLAEKTDGADVFDKIQPRVSCFFCRRPK